VDKPEYAGAVISVEARGRLGNHMFQFAFGLAAGARLGTDFAMNDELLRPAFRLGPWSSAHRRTGRAARFRATKRLAPLPVVKVDNEADPRVALEALVDGRHYAGFFQSLDFFANVQTDVRAAFEPRAHHVEAFGTRYAELANTRYVCCHVRRTDYERGGWELPVSYYRDCLRLARHDGDQAVVFVGDDLGVVEREFGADPDVRFEQNDEVVDLQLLIHATVVVTSNSSFGWWGSWLGEPGRSIYAPKYWLGFRTRKELPNRVIPVGWTQVEARTDE